MRDLRLRLWADPCLKRECSECSHTPAERIEIGEQMIEIMYANNGYGLSAPQVGLDCRIFVMRTPEMADLPVGSPTISSERKGLVFVNPVITKLGSRWVKESEGCLSLLSQRVMIERATEVTIEYSNPFHNERYDPQPSPGRLIWTAKGMDARCVQHEIDHLNGILLFHHIKSNLAQKVFLEKYFKKKRRL